MPCIIFYFIDMQLTDSSVVADRARGYMRNQAIESFNRPLIVSGSVRFDKILLLLKHQHEREGLLKTFSFRVRCVTGDTDTDTADYGASC